MKFVVALFLGLVAADDHNKTQVFDDHNKTQIFDDHNKTQIFDDHNKTQIFDDNNKTQIFDDNNKTQIFDDHNKTQIFDENNKTQIGVFDDHNKTQMAVPIATRMMQIQEDSDSSDSDSEDEDLQTKFDAFPVWADKSEFYERKLPERFSQDTDDIFMRSMIATYAHEEKSEVVEHDNGTKTGGEPTGRFWMNKDDSLNAAKEVLATHKGLTGDALNQYIATFFEKAWGHFDVNQSGWIEVLKMPQFCRFLASDQWMSLKESG